jgi:hypothetical protein
MVGNSKASVLVRLEFNELFELVSGPQIRGGLPEVSWLFFQAVRGGLAVKRPYLSHTGRASNAKKQPTGPGPKGCDENGPILTERVPPGRLKLVITPAIAEYRRMPSENHHYTKVVLNDNMPADDSLSGREIQLIIGSPSKMAEPALVEFATEFTRHIRMTQGWSTVHVIVEPIEFQELPALGQPAHTEGDRNTWIVEEH